MSSSPVQEHVLDDASAINVSKKTPLMLLLGQLHDETPNSIFDPLTDSYHIVDFPELEPQSVCLAANYGWLLLVSRRNRSLFFFDPIASRRIDIPYRNSVFEAVAFSAPPTSPHCTLIAYKEFSIDVLLVAQESAWTRYPIEFDFSFHHKFAISNPVFVNEKLYFVEYFSGKVGTFDTINGNWKFLDYSKNYSKIPKRHTMFEFEGELYSAVKNEHGNVKRMYRLKMEGGKFMCWEEVKEIGDDFAVFLGPYGTFAMRGGLSDDMNKKIMFVRDSSNADSSKYMVFDFDDYGHAVMDDSKLGPFVACWFVPVWIDRRGRTEDC